MTRGKKPRLPPGWCYWPRHHQEHPKISPNSAQKMAFSARKDGFFCPKFAPRTHYLIDSQPPSGFFCISSPPAIFSSRRILLATEDTPLLGSFAPASARVVVEFHSLNRRINAPLECTKCLTVTTILYHDFISYSRGFFVRGQKRIDELPDAFREKGGGKVSKGMSRQMNFLVCGQASLRGIFRSRPTQMGRLFSKDRAWGLTTTAAS